MFGPFASVEKKTRANAANWLELAQKIWHVRRDVLARPLLQELETNTAALHALLRERAEHEKLKSGIAALEDTLRRAGGAHYPKSELVEWVEFLLVAAIVIIGVRTYFVQPFQIPTNSMWPSYYGMTPLVYPTPASEPGPAKTALRFVTAGARPRRVDAPVAGEIIIPFDGNDWEPGLGQHGQAHYHFVPGRSWLVFPTTFRVQTLIVGQQAVSVRVPLDFDFDWVVYAAFFSDGGSYSPGALAAAVERKRATGQVERGMLDGKPVRLVHTGRTVQAGERVLSFDILAGDMLMVDRFSYHFVRPSVGDGFVFRTGGIKGIMKPDEYGNLPVESYYIKRLVGTPGDRLELREPVLYRNGAPITGAASFDKEARQAENYPGYRNGSSQLYLTRPGDSYEVQAGQYFAMGDNSPNSSDSRFWGPVPADAVIGRPLFIYYPFARWFP